MILLRRPRPVALLVALLVAAGLAGATPSTPAGAGAAGTPALTVTPVQTGLQLPWGLAFTPTPDHTMLFTERPGHLYALPAPYDGTPTEVSIDTSDLFVGGETGLLDVEVDPHFATNRRIFTCQGHQAGGAEPRIQVISWRIDEAFTAATRLRDPLVDSVTRWGPQQGRHGGCRLEFDQLGNLYVGTGDGAKTGNPQNLDRLGGKVLRVNPNNGAGVRGNPWFSSRNANRRRIWNYGHRNIQGLALRPGTQAQLWSIEHGTFRDDELNRVLKGRNFGWLPGPGYDESPPMTNHARFRNAVDAVWRSGNPTIAPSGIAFLQGGNWGTWEGALAVAILKDQHLRIFTLDGNALGEVAIPAELDHTHGRLRTPVLGPDGSLYLTTSNGAQGDEILRVTPTL